MLAAIAWLLALVLGLPVGYSFPLRLREAFACHYTS